MKINPDDTIAAISTPPGEGGIGIVRLSGPISLKIADRVFVSRSGVRPSECDTYTVHYGHIVDSDNTHIDEVILTVMRKPKSYTREDIVEINCHGGMAALRKVMDLVIRLGARPAEPGEFTKRAFLNGRLDLAQAEAVLDIIRAKTDASLRVALDQLDGGISKEVNGIIDKLSKTLSHIEVALDFPDEVLEIMREAEVAKSLDLIKKEIESLLDTADEGIILREGMLAIICGKPNVGKSSLMNLLLKRDRVIVTAIPGTTRDAVEEVINLKGFPIRIVDTAGIQETRDALDREAIERSKRYMKRADIVLFVLDGSMPIDQDDLRIRDIVKGERVIAVINKIDLPQKILDKDARESLGIESMVGISISEKKNIHLLEGEILKFIESGKAVQNEGAIVTNARHKGLIEGSLRHVVQAKGSFEEGLSAEFIAQDLKEACYHLGLIVGRSVSGEIFDMIFSEFCIGK